MSDTAPQPIDAGRLAFLDALRAVAALMVLVTHALGLLSPEFEAFRFTLFDMGSCGVTVFFLCSGFIIPASLERRRSMRSFWVRRFFRLYPLYWMSLLLLVPCYLLGLTSYSADFAARPAATLLTHLTMLQTLLGFQHLSVVYWTLTFELVFYVVMSALTLARVGRYTGPLLVGLAAAALLVEVALPRITGQRVPLALLGSLVIMVSGTVFYRLHAGQMRPAAALALVALALGTVLATALANNAAGNLYLATAWAAGYAIFGLVFALRRAPVPRWLRYLGEISYSLYLTHPALMLLVPRTPWLALTAAIWIGCTLLVSAATYRWVERPAIALGERLSRPDSQHDLGGRRAAGQQLLERLRARH